ncbi:MAG: hypothetical protein R3A11_00035 [Bdellovibrionota bacterium]
MKPFRIMAWTFFAAALMAAVHSSAQADTATALVNGRETYVTTDNGETQRYGIGDIVYVVKDPKEKRDGFYRVTLDPSDNIGIGWIDKKSVKITSGFRNARKQGAQAISPDPKPAHDDSHLPIPEARSSNQASDVNDSPSTSSNEMTFLDQLILEESQQGGQELPSTSTRNFGKAAPTQNDQKAQENPFSNDLEFLFDDQEVSSTLQEAKKDLSSKAAVAASSTRTTFGVASFFDAGETDGQVKASSSYFEQSLAKGISGKQKVKNLPHVKDVSTFLRFSPCLDLTTRAFLSENSQPLLRHETSK